MKRLRRVRWNWIFAVTIFTGCTQMCGVGHEDMTAEQVVEAYLQVALNMTDVSQRDELLEYTTGDLAAALAGATDEAIREAYIEKRYALRKYSLIERRDRTPRETEITYQLTYNEVAKGVDEKDAPLVTTDNTVSVIRKKGVWFVQDVLGNKTSIEFPVTQLNTIRASSGK